MPENKATMYRRTADARKRLIERTGEIARDASDRGRIGDMPGFLDQYYRTVGLDDLRVRKPEDLAGGALAHVALADQRLPGTPLVRVYNPERETDGWQSSHTIVEIVNDDMPFIVDSTAMVVNSRGPYVHLTVHPVLRVQRDSDGALIRVLDEDGTAPDAINESFLRLEIDRDSNLASLDALRDELLATLSDVRSAVEDWGIMRTRAREIADDLDRNPPPLDPEVIAESRAMIEWMEDENFTFLGYREYDLVTQDDAIALQARPGTGLGILRNPSRAPRSSGRPLSASIRRQVRSKDLLVITKANAKATVHRPGYLDYVGVKTFDSAGKVTGEKRFLGLWTSVAYSQSPRDIPLLRAKIRQVMDSSGFRSDSRGGKALLHILETYPRDELLQATVAEIFRISNGIASLQERQRVKLFLRRDAFRRFYSCLVFVPRDRYNTQVRERIQDILMEALGGTAVESTVKMSESNLARVHLIIRTDPEASPRIQIRGLERRLEDAVRTWKDRIRSELVDRLGEETGLDLWRKYADAFPAAYQEDVPTREATFDIERLDATVANPDELRMSLYRPPTFPEQHVRFKLFRAEEPLPLSDVLPMLENMGLRVISERPYKVRLDSGFVVWIQDFEMRLSVDRRLNLARANESFQAAFDNIWHGRADNDRFNRLILLADLDWREISLLRACSRYLLQTGMPFSQSYMEEVLTSHPRIAALLIDNFRARFDPAMPEKRRERQALSTAQALDHAMDSVVSLDADRILSGFRAVIRAALRTNYFQPDPDGQAKPYLSLKLNPALIPDLPKPRPRFEVFVHSPTVEGVHLRGGKVARGGLRWSDRREDFRTEVLGLMKAQAVKNVLIVPVGAKGGFVCKRLPSGPRDVLMKAVVGCYRTFIRGLLDITDNLVDGEITPPGAVVRHDGDDNYLVVAADKGTATFSDIANELALDYGFWLGDAFASGGSVGYDHKKMGITARGGWEAVKRHFREIGIDVQTHEFTAVGIGDMSGDVFGNGMLQSRHIRLNAAFNHLHIFLDPEPDPGRSFDERQRLFEMPRSGWTDYDPTLISRGGGVFERTEKLIRLSPEVQSMLGIEDKSLTPDELIRAILRMPCDLLWNGGIGTYVKAGIESHAEVGDRSSDSVRVNAGDLRCKVVGEGGNLGVTQLARIEFGLHGGRINTDFIDNSAGVDCSDREVNIKILLNQVGKRQRLTPARREKLLMGMTDEVSNLVLRNNYLQTQAISLMEVHAAERIREHAWLIRLLEKNGVLDRELEFLPGEEAIEERRKAGRGLTRPELAVLMSYSKIALYADMIRSSVPEDAYLGKELVSYFPAPLRKRYQDQMSDHPLSREIVATLVTNSLVNRMGSVFAFRMQEENGADAAAVARAFSVAREVFDIRSVWQDIEALDNSVHANVQYSMMLQTQRLIKHATQWFLDRRDLIGDIAAAVERYHAGASNLAGSVEDVLCGHEQTRYEEARDLYAETGVPAKLAERMAALRPMTAVLDILEVAETTQRGAAFVASVYFRLGEDVHLDWIRDQIERLAVDGHWQAMARGSLRENLYTLQSRLAEQVVRGGSESSATEAVDAWLESRSERVEHIRHTTREMRASGPLDFPTASVALQEIRRLAHG